METTTVKATCTEKDSLPSKEWIDPGATLAFMVTRDKQAHYVVSRKESQGQEAEHCRKEVPSQMTRDPKNAGWMSAVCVTGPPQGGFDGNTTWFWD